MYNLCIEIKIITIKNSFLIKKSLEFFFKSLLFEVTIFSWLSKVGTSCLLYQKIKIDKLFTFCKNRSPIYLSVKGFFF